jgi:hypothetical protein
VQEVQQLGGLWPVALAAHQMAAKRAWLRPEAVLFTYVPHLSKLSAEAFIVEQLMGKGLGGLEAFKDEGEWISVVESFELLRPYEQEAFAMVSSTAW